MSTINIEYLVKNKTDLVWDLAHFQLKTWIATSRSLFLVNFGQIEQSFGEGMKTYLVEQMPVFLSCNLFNDLA